MRRQNHAHAKAISSLQTKLTAEREDNQQLRQSLTSLSKRATSSSGSPSESSASEEVARLRGELKQREEEIHTLRMEKETLIMSGASEGTSTSETAHLLEEKDEEIRDLTEKLQKFHKTAKDFLKIAQHSKGQREMINHLRENLEQAVVCTCTCIDHALQTCTCIYINMYAHTNVDAHVHVHIYESVFLVATLVTVYLFTLYMLLSRLMCLSYRVRKMNWLQAKMPLLQRFLCYPWAPYGVVHVLYMMYSYTYSVH